MSAPDLVIFNTLERLISTDLNRVGGLAGKSVQDAMIAIGGGIVATEAPKDVVRRGLDAIPGSGMQVLVGVGETMRFDSTITSADLSKYLLGRLDAQTGVAITAAHGTLHRIDLVYAQVATVDQEQQLRNVLTLPGRTITPTLIYKVRRPSLTLGVVDGTASAFPAFAGHALPAGAVPLWYVFVDAASTSISSDRLFDARVRFHPSALAKSHGREEGLLVDAASSTVAQVSAGRGWADGSLGELQATTAISRTLLLGAWPADTEFHLYMIPTGGGRTAPTCKTAPSGVVFAAATTAPDSYGRPSSAIGYNPALLAPTQPPAFTQPQTTQALYLGTLRTNSAGNFEAASIPLAKSGLERTANRSVVSSGFPGRVGGWIKKPDLSWSSVTTVTASGVVVIAGVVIPFASISATMPGSIVGGSETASTFYYCYVRPAIAPSGFNRSFPRELALIFSPEAPNSTGGKPTPETGYQSDEYVFAGTVYNNAASDIQRFIRQGDLVIWTGAVSGTEYQQFAPATPATFPILTTVPLKLPSTSRLAKIMLQIEATGAYTTAALFLRNGTGSGVNVWSWDKNAFPVVSTTSEVSFVSDLEIGESAAGFEMTKDAGPGAGAFNVRIYQRGYFEPLG